MVLPEGEAALPLLTPKWQWRADQGSASNSAFYLKDNLLISVEELQCPIPQSMDVARVVIWILFICLSGSWNLDILR